MKRKIILLFTLLLFSVSVSVLAASSSDKVRFYDETEGSNLLSFGNKIVVNGEVKKTLIKFGGSLKLNGKVGRDVVCISSDVELGPDFRIGGDLIVIGGTLTGKNEDNIGGDVHHVNLSLKKFESSLTSFDFSSGTLGLIRVFFLLISLIISLIIFGIIPLKVRKAEELLNDNRMRIGSLGILSVLGFAFMILISIILSFIYIGIPILLILMLILICLFVFGRTILYYAIGQWLINKFSLSIFSPAISILTGVIVYGILNFIPIAGFIILKIFAFFELGIAVGFLFRRKLNLKSISEFVAEYGND